MLLSSDSAEQKCLVCSGVLSECAIKCGDCKRAAHLECTQLPMYHLVRLASSRTAYTCIGRVRGNTKVNYTEFEAELQHFRRLQSSEVAQAAHHPSAPTLSQIPSTAGDLEGDGEQQNAQRYNESDDTPECARSRPSSTGRIGRPLQEVCQRKPICRFYKAGTCKHGKARIGCKYDHPKKCLAYIRFGSKRERLSERQEV